MTEEFQSSVWLPTFGFVVQVSGTLLVVSVLAPAATALTPTNMPVIPSDNNTPTTRRTRTAVLLNRASRLIEYRCFTGMTIKAGTTSLVTA